MSLGLGDLNKNKKRPVKKSSDSPDLSKGKGAWSKQKSARPWSEPARLESAQAADQPSLSSETTIGADSFHHEAIFSWADISNTSALARLQMRLAALETQARHVIEERLKAARDFISRELR